MKKVLAIFALIASFAGNAEADHRMQQHQQQPHYAPPQMQYRPQYQPQPIQTRPQYQAPQPNQPQHHYVQRQYPVQQQIQAQPKRQAPQQHIPQNQHPYQPAQRPQRLEVSSPQSQVKDTQNHYHHKASGQHKDHLSKLSKHELKERIQDLKGEKLNGHYDRMSKNELRKEVKLLEKSKHKSEPKQIASDNLSKHSKKELKSRIKDLKGEELNSHYNKMSKRELVKEVKLLQSTTHKTARYQDRTHHPQAAEQPTPLHDSSPNSYQSQGSTPHSTTQNIEQIAVGGAKEGVKQGVINEAKDFVGAAAKPTVGAAAEGFVAGAVDAGMKAHYEKQGQKCPKWLPFFFCAPSAQ